MYTYKQIIDVHVFIKSISHILSKLKVNDLDRVHDSITNWFQRILLRQNVYFLYWWLPSSWSCSQENQQCVQAGDTAYHLWDQADQASFAPTFLKISLIFTKGSGSLRRRCNSLFFNHHRYSLRNFHLLDLRWRRNSLFSHRQWYSLRYISPSHINECLK